MHDNRASIYNFASDGEICLDRTRSLLLTYTLLSWQGDWTRKPWQEELGGKTVALHTLLLLQHAAGWPSCAWQLWFTPPGNTVEFHREGVCKCFRETKFGEVLIWIFSRTLWISFCKFVNKNWLDFTVSWRFVWQNKLRIKWAIKNYLVCKISQYLDFINLSIYESYFTARSLENLRSIFSEFNLFLHWAFKKILTNCKIISWNYMFFTIHHLNGLFWPPPSS